MNCDFQNTKNSKGHLFTKQRPTLACNQIDTMLAELNRKDESLSVGQIRAGRFSSYRPPRPSMRMPAPRFRTPRPNFRAPFAPSQRRNFPQRSGCIRCLEARRYDAARFHNLQNCPYPRAQIKRPIRRELRFSSSKIRTILRKRKLKKAAPIKICS